MALETYTVKIEAEITKFLTGIRAAQAAISALDGAAASASGSANAALTAIARTSAQLEAAQVKLASTLTGIGQKLQTVNDDLLKQQAKLAEGSATAAIQAGTKIAAAEEAAAAKIGAIREKLAADTDRLNARRAQQAETLALKETDSATRVAALERAVDEERLTLAAKRLEIAAEAGGVEEAINERIGQGEKTLANARILAQQEVVTATKAAAAARTAAEVAFAEKTTLIIGENTAEHVRLIKQVQAADEAAGAAQLQISKGLAEQEGVLDQIRIDSAKEVETARADADELRLRAEFESAQKVAALEQKLAAERIAIERARMQETRQAAEVEDEITRRRLAAADSEAVAERALADTRVAQTERAASAAEKAAAAEVEAVVAAAAKRSELNNAALAAEAEKTAAVIKNAEAQNAAAASTGEAALSAADKISVAGGIINTVFAALDVAAVLLIARGLNELGESLIHVSQNAADTGGQFQLFQGIVKNALDRANEATSGATGTLEQFNATIAETSQLFGAAQIDVAKTTARLLELQPSLGLTGDQLRNVIKTVTVLGVQFKDQGRVLTDFADAFEKLPLPIRRLIGADVTAAATQKELNRIIAEGGDQAKLLAGKTEELQRVQAVYNILIRAATPYVKAFQEQQDNAYLASNRLDAALLDLQNRFGAFTGPALAEATGALITLVRTITALPDFFFAAAAAVTLFVGASAKVAGSVLEASVVIGGLAGAVTALNAVLAATIPILGGTVGAALTTFFTRVTGVAIEITTAGALFRAFSLSVATGLAGAATAVANFFENVAQGNLSLGGLNATLALVSPKLLEFAGALGRISLYLSVFAVLGAAALEAAHTISDVGTAAEATSGKIQLANDSISTWAASLEVIKGALQGVRNTIASIIEGAIAVFAAALVGLITIVNETGIRVAALADVIAHVGFKGYGQAVADARKEATAFSGVQDELIRVGLAAGNAVIAEGEKTRILAFNMKDAKDAILLANAALVSTTPAVEALGGAFVLTGNAAATAATHNVALARSALDTKTKLDIETKALQDQVKVAEGVGKAQLALAQQTNDAIILEIERTAKTNQDAKERIQAQEIQHALDVVRINEGTAKTVEAIFQKQADAEIRSSQQVEEQAGKQQKNLVKAASEANAKVLQLREAELQKNLSGYEAQLSQLRKFEGQRYDEVRASELKIREIHAETADKLFEIQLQENEATLDGYKESGAEAIDIQNHIDAILAQARQALADKDYELAQQLTKKAESLAERLDKVSTDSAGAVFDRHRAILGQVQDINVEAQQGIGGAAKAAAEDAAKASAIIQAKIGEALTKIADVEEKLRTARETISITILPEDSPVRAALRDLANTVVSVPVHLDFTGGTGTIFTQVKDDLEFLRKSIEAAPPLHIPTAITEIDITGGSVHTLIEAADILKQILTPTDPLFVKVAIAKAFLGGADVGGALDLTAVPAALIQTLTPTEPITIPVALPNVNFAVLGDVPFEQAADFIHNNLAAVQAVDIPAAIPSVDIDGQPTALNVAGDTLVKVIQPLTPFDVFGKVGIIDPKTGGITYDTGAGKDIVAGLFGTIPPFDIPLTTGTYELQGVGTFSISDGGGAIKDTLTPKEPIEVPVKIADNADVPGGSLHPLTEVGATLKQILNPKEPLDIQVTVNAEQIKTGIAALQQLGLSTGLANEAMNTLANQGITAAIVKLQQFGFTEQEATKTVNELTAAIEKQGAAAEHEGQVWLHEASNIVTATGDISKNLKAGGVAIANTTAGLNEILKVQAELAQQAAQQAEQARKQAEAEQARRREERKRFLEEDPITTELAGLSTAYQAFSRIAQSTDADLVRLGGTFRSQVPTYEQLREQVAGLGIASDDLLHRLDLLATVSVQDAVGSLEQLIVESGKAFDVFRALAAAGITDVNLIRQAITDLGGQIETTPFKLHIKPIVDVPGGSPHTPPEVAGVLHDIIQPGLNRAPLAILFDAKTDPVYAEFLQLYHYIAGQTIPVRLKATSIDIPGGSLHTLPDAAAVIRDIISPGVIPAQLELLKAQVPQVPYATLPGGASRGGGGTLPERRVTVDLRLNDASYPVTTADEKSAENLVAFAKQLKTVSRSQGEFRSVYSR